MKKTCLIFLSIVLLFILPLCISSANSTPPPQLADTTEFVFTMNEIDALSKYLSFVNETHEDDFRLLHQYINGSEEITSDEALEALNRLYTFDKLVREYGTAVLDAFNEKTMRDMENAAVITFVLNKHTMKYHMPNCSSVKDIKESNRQDFYGSRLEVINLGYSPCGVCNPQRNSPY